MLSESPLDPYLEVAEQFLHGWMHMMFVTGAWNLVAHLLCETMLVISNEFYSVVRGYVRNWRCSSRLKINIIMLAHDCHHVRLRDALRNTVCEFRGSRVACT